MRLTGAVDKTDVCIAIHATDQQNDIVIPNQWSRDLRDIQAPIPLALTLQATHTDPEA